MMRNGRILCAVSSVPTSSDHYPAPTSFFEYDPVSNAFASASAPGGATEPGSCYGTMLLDLPDGNVLFSHFGPQLHVYSPAGASLASGKPVIANTTPNADGSFHLTGTGLTGISEGASYGDDYQMSTNYPLVRLTGTSGGVRYARTYDWSTTSIRTGAALLSTEFRVPPTLPPGTYQLEVIANGIASDPVSFPWSTLFGAACFGDGTSAACPCLNPGAAGHGCENSTLSSGAQLSGSGLPSLAADSVQVLASGEPSNSLSVLIQGSSSASPIPFGGGLRCVGGSLRRLYSRAASGGSISLPPTGGPSISARSALLGDAIHQGEVRVYQVYYRDPDLGYCSAGFNATNSVTVSWRP
jgi:hypothetical protein